MKVFSKEYYVGTIMLKKLFVFFLVIHFVYCAKIRNSIYDQDLSLPQTTRSCGELRKQFENGYIHLRDFLDRIRSCKESSGDRRHQRRHHHHYMNHHSTQEKPDSTFTYTDYLVPVLRTSSDKPTESYKKQRPIGEALTSNQINTGSNGDTTMFPTKRYIKPKTINGIVVDSIAGQLILRSLQNKEYSNPKPRFAVPTYELPTTNQKTTLGSHAQSWSDYFQFRNLLDNMGYDNTMKNNHKEAFVDNQLSPISESINNQNLLNSEKRTVQSITSPQKDSQENSQPSSSDQDSLSLLSATINQVLPPQIISSNFFASPTHSDEDISLKFQQNAQILQQLSNIASPTHQTSPSDTRSLNQGVLSSDIQNNDLTLLTKSSVGDLQKIERVLQDDVSLLNENKPIAQHLSLTEFESFAPQIIEKIAERSTINKVKNAYQHTKTADHSTKSKDQNVNNATSIKIMSSIDNGDSTKDILDIKYSQLEEKLLNDLKKRQAVLQKLEQESMVQHFLQPGTIPMEKLSNAFEQLNDETAQRSSAGLKKSIQNSSLKPSQVLQLEDELGLFETNQKPTKKRSQMYKDFAHLKINSLSNQGLNAIAQNLPHNFVLSNYVNKLFRSKKKYPKSKMVPINNSTYSNNNSLQDASPNILKVTYNTLKSNNTSSIPDLAESRHHADKILQKSKNVTYINTTKGKVGEKRTNIPTATSEKLQTFSRNILFTNKLYNNVIRAAMKRKDTIGIPKQNKPSNEKKQKKNFIPTAPQHIDFSINKMMLNEERNIA